MNLLATMTAEDVTKYFVDQPKKCYPEHMIAGEHPVIGA